MGIGCIDPHFLDLGTSCRWVVSFTPLPLYLRGKSPLYPLYRRLGGPQSRFGRNGEVKILALSELKLRLLRPPACSQSPYRLSYPGSYTVASLVEALCCKPEGRGLESRWGGFSNIPNASSRTMARGSTQPLTEMSTRNLPGGKRAAGA
jgi:hypothetical protein